VPRLAGQEAEGVLSCGYLLCPGRGGGGGLALVVGSNLPPFLGSYVSFLDSVMVIPLTSQSTVHARGDIWPGARTPVNRSSSFSSATMTSGGTPTRPTARPGGLDGAWRLALDHDVVTPRPRRRRVNLETQPVIELGEAHVRFINNDSRREFLQAKAKRDGSHSLNGRLPRLSRRCAESPQLSTRQLPVSDRTTTTKEDS
jgi:hypothetical protein